MKSNRDRLNARLSAGLLAFCVIPWAAAQQQTITPTAKQLNKSFDADASQWTERFEHEGRAIYDSAPRSWTRWASNRAWTWRISARAAA